MISIQYTINVAPQVELPFAYALPVRQLEEIWYFRT